jgi:Asp-tRNA(Asn)/Glu-tRNA(Gln) amidotransferase A subunit family amidase
MFADDFRINGKVVDLEFGFADNGVPTGIQIVGRAFDDLTVYRAGFAFEQARGPWYRSDSLRPRLGGTA